MGINNSLANQENRVRVGWEEAIEEALAEHGHERLDDEWFDLLLVAGETLEW